MIKSCNAIILKTKRLRETIDFYQALGMTLEKEQHGEGPLHFTCKFGGIHFAIYEIDNLIGEDRRAANPDTMLGFEIESLSETLNSLQALGVKIMIDPEDVPWGRRAVVLDPDGRPTELNESR